ncbi:MAG: GntR family transcriptional regulator [Acidobacteriota bacterium]
MSERDTDITLRFDPASSVPAYRQIVDGLRQHLVAGVFEPGDRLPPVRRLAMDLGVHHNTVAEAYRRLADEGWLSLARGRGATVADRSAPEASAETERSIAASLDALIAEAQASGASARWIHKLLTSTARKLQEDA